MLAPAAAMPAISRALANKDTMAALTLLETLGEALGEEIPILFAVEALAALEAHGEPRA